MGNILWLVFVSIWTNDDPLWPQETLMCCFFHTFKLRLELSFDIVTNVCVDAHGSNSNVTSNQ